MVINFFFRFFNSQETKDSKPRLYIRIVWEVCFKSTVSSVLSQNQNLWVWPGHQGSFPWISQIIGCAATSGTTAQGCELSSQEGESSPFPVCNPVLRPPLPSYPAGCLAFHRSSTKSCGSMILCSIGWLSDPWNDLVSTLLPQHRPRSGGCLWLSPSCVWLFCSPMDYSLSGFSVHGIVQARILERVAISFSRGSSRARNQTCYWQEGFLSLSHQESPTGIPLV